MIDRYAAMVEVFPIWRIEDGLGESDHDGWKRLTSRLGERVQVLGDDNICTNPVIIAAAISDGIANAALIKLNQIGSVTETLDAMTVCHRWIRPDSVAPLQ
jgi:enolase